MQYRAANFAMNHFAEYEVFIIVESCPLSQQARVRYR